MGRDGLRPLGGALREQNDTRTRLSLRGKARQPLRRPVEPGRPPSGSAHPLSTERTPGTHSLAPGAQRLRNNPDSPRPAPPERLKNHPIAVPPASNRGGAQAPPRLLFPCRSAPLPQDANRLRNPSHPAPPLRPSSPSSPLVSHLAPAALLAALLLVPSPAAQADAQTAPLSNEALELAWSVLTEQQRRDVTDWFQLELSYLETFQLGFMALGLICRPGFGFAGGGFDDRKLLGLIHHK